MKIDCLLSFSNTIYTSNSESIKLKVTTVKTNHIYCIDDAGESQDTVEAVAGPSKNTAKPKKRKMKDLERENIKMYNKLLKVILPKAEKLFGSSSNFD